MSRREAGDLDLVGMPSERRGRYLSDAPRADLLRTADTDEAKALIAVLLGAAEAHEKAVGTRTYRRGEKALGKLSAALSGIVGDLLCAKHRGTWGGLVHWSQDRNGFKGRPYLFTDYVVVREYLVAAGLMEHFPGYRPLPNVHFGAFKVSTTPGRRARFRATPDLLELAENSGVLLDYSEDHFPAPAPAAPAAWAVRLKAAKRHLNAKGGEMEATGWPERVGQELQRITSFLAATDIEGGSFSGLFRQFELGDQPGFNWATGGRLYAYGDHAYQGLPKEARTAMRINGEPVVEIDIKASYLTILYGKAGLEIDRTSDPYALPWLDREVIKTWVAASITNGEPLQRWNAKHRATYANKHPGKTLDATHKPAAVEAAVTIRHPVLRDLPNLGVCWASLMYVESEAIIGTMLELLDHGVPSLPVHDSLIVPALHEDLAKGLLEGHFERVAGIRPMLDVRGPSTTAVTPSMAA